MAASRAREGHIGKERERVLGLRCKATKYAKLQKFLSVTAGQREKNAKNEVAHKRGMNGRAKKVLYRGNGG